MSIKVEKQPLRNDEHGLVSLIVVTILMFVITITTISFSNTVRTEQRQALDHQLNTQAYYAAETGINYAKKVISDKVKAGVPISQLGKVDCPAQPISPTTYYTDTLTLTDRTNVSCLLVTSNPKSLVYDLDTTQPSKVFPIKPESPINKIVLEWTPVAGSTGSCPAGSPAVDNLPDAASWNCPYGVLRADLTNTGDAGAALTRVGLSQSTFSNLFMPLMTTSGGSVSFAGANAFGGGARQGTRAAAKCSSDLCSMTVTLGGDTTNQFYMRLQTIYQNTKVTIKALNSSNQQIAMKDAQIVIDATGKSEDVLRRVQVRVPLVNDGLHADYGVQTKEDLCKYFKAYPDSGYPNTSGC